MSATGEYVDDQPNSGWVGWIVFAAIFMIITGAMNAIQGLAALFRDESYWVTLGGAVDAHHDQARFTWHLAPQGAAEPVVIGFDVAVVEQDRIGSVYGFLDKVPG